MFDYQSEFVISRMERERRLKALAVHREAAAGAVLRPQPDSTS